MFLLDVINPIIILAPAAAIVGIVLALIIGTITAIVKKLRK